MNKQFSDVAKISRETMHQPKVKIDFKVTSFLTEFNPVLPDLNKLIRNRLQENQLKQFTMEVRIGKNFCPLHHFQ